ncbi:MAG: hypothetical protein EKK63_10960 [Acinetobacter sp.]|uniref:sigma-70 family RNA polymerase sigma factor n=1 Tax=Acinetobacter sp. TaxID=472 RepID=UPI000FBE7D84|nr:sigma factor-like helix-turn-helix DNA-binding protein [Acinetobacter sp.]RUP38886.1 MAG: hypothetical protein EKK63_10960 [Acinetobacter sp.]
MPKHNPNGPTGLYNYDNYNRPLTNYELKTVCEITVLYEYRRLKQFTGPNVALQELLKRHDNILQMIALKSHKRYDLTSDYEDKLQHARYGAMRAYDKFDIEKAQEGKFHLYNYVCNCVSMYLHTANDEDDYINCPPTRRIIRSYLSGRYDLLPRKKKEVEKRLGLRTPEDESQLRVDYGALVADYISTDTPTDTPIRWKGDAESTLDEILSGATDGDINERIYLSELISRLTNRQQQVVKTVFIDGHKMNEAAKILDISEDQVRGDVQRIRKKLKAIISKESVLM